MLNLLRDYREPGRRSAVSGITAAGWRRPATTSSNERLVMRDLVERLPPVPTDLLQRRGLHLPTAILEMPEGVGTVKEFKATYNAYPGAETCRAANVSVTEHLYLGRQRRLAPIKPLRERPGPVER